MQPWRSLRYCGSTSFTAVGGLLVNFRVFYIAVHADLDNRLDVTVRFQGKYVVIAALVWFPVFHQEFVAIALGERFLG